MTAALFLIGANLSRPQSFSLLPGDVRLRSAAEAADRRFRNIAATLRPLDISASAPTNFSRSLCDMEVGIRTQHRGRNTGVSPGATLWVAAVRQDPNLVAPARGDRVELRGFFTQAEIPKLYNGSNSTGG